MTNTSAYANVLLKSPVAASSVAEPKRDYKNESSADFHKTLKDVNEGLKSQSERIKKSADNKFEQLERQKDLKETKAFKENNALSSKDPQDSKTAVSNASQKESKYDSTDAQQNSFEAKTETTASPIEQENKKTTVNKPIIAAQNDELNQEAVLAEMNPTIVPLTADLSVSIDTSLDEATSDADYLDSVTSLNTLPGASSDVTAEIGVTALVNSPSVIFADENLVSAKTQSTENTVTSTQALTADKMSPVLNSSNLPIDESSQVIPVAQPTIPVDVVDAQSLVSAPVAPTKPSQPSLVMAEVADDAQEMLVSLTPETSKAAKVISANTPTTVSPPVANTPETTTQLQMQASKTAFEKTLQAAVASESISSDDALVASPSSSNSSTHSPMDSLMRGADSHTPSSRSFVVQTTVPVPVGQPQWSQAVGEKVLWLAAQNVSSAEINLHPKDLGPMQVKVSVNQEQTTVSFTSQHAVVREVLDQNLNRLRDMFNEQGLNLVNVDVSDKSFSRQHGDAQGQKGQGGSSDVSSEEEKPVAMSAIVQQRLVDHYA